MKNIRSLSLALLCSVAFITLPLSAQTSFTVRNAKAGGNFLWSLAASPSLIVAVGDGGTILTSPRNGASWTRTNSGVTNWLVGVTYALDKFVAVGDNGRIIVSSDGLRWTSIANTGTTQRLNNIIYAGGQFVAVGEAGTILTSPDAATWTLRASGVTSWLRGIGYLPFSYQTPAGVTAAQIADSGKLETVTAIAPYGPAATGYDYVACGQGGVILRSPDGVTWFKLPSGGAPFFGSNDLETLVDVGRGVDYAPTGQLRIPTGTSSFVAIGQNGAVGNFGRVGGYADGVLGTFRYTSSFGFRAYTTGSSARLRGIAQGVNALYATGEGGTILSAPGVAGPWTAENSGTTANLVGGLFIGNSLFVVGENETILQSAPLYNSRLTNISTRGRVGTGGDIMISGIVITGDRPKTVLMRASGPTLAGFGVPGTITAPVLTLLDGSGRAIATNSGWGTATNAATISATAARVGAFPFPAASADSAILQQLAPGGYTMQVSGSNGGTGVALVEAYDADGIDTETSRAVNIATRGFVGTGGEALFAGFNIAGAASRRVLIRAVGPTLGSFGVPGTLAKPVLELYDAKNVLKLTVTTPWAQQANDDEIRGAAAQTGAFPLSETSNDLALVTTLSPGGWTVKVTGAGNTTGVALVEVYDLP